MQICHVCYPKKRPTKKYPLPSYSGNNWICMFCSWLWIFVLSLLQPKYCRVTMPAKTKTQQTQQEQLQNWIEKNKWEMLCSHFLMLLLLFLLPLPFFVNKLNSLPQICSREVLFIYCCISPEHFWLVVFLPFGFFFLLFGTNLHVVVAFHPRWNC